MRLGKPKGDDALQQLIDEDVVAPAARQGLGFNQPTAARAASGSSAAVASARVVQG